MSQKEELYMYIIINNDLPMGKGKILAQGAHAVSNMTEMMIRNHPDIWKEYKKLGMAKIAVKADEKTMLNMIDKHGNILTYTIDAGRTQIQPGSLTSIAFMPMQKSKIPDDLSKTLKGLKLL